MAASVHPVWMEGELPAEVTELFRALPGDFVATRSALVDRLLAEGRDGDAAAVKALRKPTLVVWALNQLAERDPDGVAELLDAGAELRAAQKATLSGGGGADRLRSATVARREAIAAAVAVATAALDELGSGGAAQSDRLAGALEAASVDADAGRSLGAGTFETAPSAPSGFGEVVGLTGMAGGRAGEPAAQRAAQPSKAERSRLQRQRDAAAKAASRDRAQADRLARELGELRGRLDSLETTHAAAEAKALESELALQRAERDAKRATSRRG